jgi:DNA-directed RNA polymerase delta subunit
MDDARRAALGIALEEARRDRDRLDTVIEFLTEKLGGNAPVILSLEAEGASLARDVGPLQIAPAEFYGMSSTAAAKAVLEKAGRSRPMTTDDLLEAITKGGVRLGGKTPSQTLYRSLFRNQEFHRVGRGRWGLSVWYGSAVRAKPAATTTSIATAEATAVEEPGAEPDVVLDDQTTPQSDEEPVMF